MMTRQTVRITGAVLALAVLGACKGAPDVLKPGPKKIAQHGYAGVGMETNYDPDDIAKTAAYNQAPKPLPPAPPGPPGQYQNVQVLTNISAAEFGRTMTAMSSWVAGGPGNCAYCHNTANFAADSNKGQPIYTKLVARMMLRMTRRVTPVTAASRCRKASGSTPPRTRSSGITWIVTTSACSPTRSNRTTAIALPSARRTTRTP